MSNCSSFVSGMFSAEILDLLDITNYTANCTYSSMMSDLVRLNRAEGQGAASAKITTVLSLLAGTFISLIILVIISGNILVVLAVIKDRQLKSSVQNRFIVSLAVADLLIGGFVMPLSLHLEMLGYWALGAIMCDIWLAMDVFLCTASTLSLVVVSLDRYWSVNKALVYPQMRTSRKVNISIAGIWIASAAVSLPPLAGWKLKPPSADDVSPQCNLSDELGYIIYSLTISFYIPLIIILMAYGRIFLVARKRSKQRLELGTIQAVPLVPTLSPISTTRSYAIKSQAPALVEVSNAVGRNSDSLNTSLTSKYMYDQNGNQSLQHTSYDCSNSTPSTTRRIDRRLGMFNLAASPLGRLRCSHLHLNRYSHHHLNRCSRKMSSHQAREGRATITIAIIVVAFVICWLPFSTLYLVDRLCNCGIRDSPAFTIIFWLGYCNSAVNPVLYSIFNRDFRLAFRRLLCKRRNDLA